MCDLKKKGKENKRKVKLVWSDKITKIRLDKEIDHMCRNKRNKRSGKHRGKCIKSGNNECRKCPKNAKNIRKNIPCDTRPQNIWIRASNVDQNEGFSDLYLKVRWRCLSFIWQD